MKTTKIIYSIICIIAVSIVFFGFKIETYFPAIWDAGIVIGLVWFYFCVSILMFTYYFQKRIYLVGIKGQKELKRHIGLKRLGVSFKEYRRYIYHNRFNSKDEKAESEVDFTEEYLKSTKIKHALSVILFSLFYAFILYYIIPQGFTKLAVPILSFIILLFVIDFSIIRVRYEESIFKSKTYNAAAKELMKQSGITTN